MKPHTAHDCQMPARHSRAMGKVQARFLAPFFARILAISPPEIDRDALTREIARNAGIPQKMLRTPEQVAIFRKRSASAKLGWKRRRRRHS